MDYPIIFLSSVKEEECKFINYKELMKSKPPSMFQVGERLRKVIFVKLY
jgi:hypothetical protein